MELYEDGEFGDGPSGKKGGGGNGELEMAGAPQNRSFATLSAWVLERRLGGRR